MSNKNSDHLIFKQMWKMNEIKLITYEIYFINVSTNVSTNEYLAIDALQIGHDLVTIYHTLRQLV